MAGSVTISVELELGWGSHDKADYSRLSKNRNKESKYLKKLLNTCDKNNIKLTFNVVGKLLTDNNITRVDRSLYPEGWWEEYDNATADQQQLFHATDLIQAICDADVEHEFASHTYSHVMVDEVSNKCVCHEFSLMEDIFEEWDIDQPHSFVAPRHRTISSDTLNKNGIQVVRTPDTEQTNPSVGVSAWMLYRSHPVKEPQVEDGILKTYSSSYPSLTFSGVLANGQQEADNHFQYIPVSLRQRRQEYYLKRAVRKAQNRNSHTHLWTHLWDMSNEQQWGPINTFLEWLGKKSNTENVSVHRMKDLSDVYGDGGL